MADNSNADSESYYTGEMQEGEASDPECSSLAVKMEQASSDAAADAPADDDGATDDDDAVNINGGNDDDADTKNACTDHDRPSQEDLGHASSNLLDEEEEAIKRHSLQILALTSNSTHSSKYCVDQSMTFPFPKKQEKEDHRASTKSTSTDCCAENSKVGILTTSFSSSVSSSMKMSVASFSDSLLNAPRRMKLDSVKGLTSQEEGNIDEIASSLEYWKENNSACPDSSDQGRHCERTSGVTQSTTQRNNIDYETPPQLVSSRQESRVGAYAMAGQPLPSSSELSHSESSHPQLDLRNLGVGVPVVSGSTALVCATLAEDPQDVEAQVRARIMNEAVQAEVVSMEDVITPQQRISKKHKTYCVLVVLLVLVIAVAVGIPIGASKQEPSQGVGDPIEIFRGKSTIQEIQDRGVLRCGVYDTTRPINIVSGLYS